MTINKGIDEELFREITEKAFNSSFQKLLGMELLEVGPGEALVMMRGQKKFLNYLSIVHGGALASLCDTAMGMAVRSLGAFPATVEMKINYISPGKEDQDIYAKGRVLKKGKTLLVTEAELTSGGNLISKAVGTFFNMKEPQD